MNLSSARVVANLKVPYSLTPFSQQGSARVCSSRAFPANSRTPVWSFFTVHRGVSSWWWRRRSNYDITKYHNPPARLVGLTEGYKNPPVPRRLVGESHIPPNLSPAYTDLGSSLSRTRLAGEQGKVRTGPKTGLQLRRLPVRPQGGQGQTHTRALADLNRQDIVNPVRSGVHGPEVYVPYRPANSHRKTSPPGATSYEAHTVALEKQLEGTRVTGKGDTRSQVHPPSLKMVAREKQCSSRSTITPSKHALQIFTDASKKGWGAHLNERTARGIWSVPESKLHINHLELKAVFLALKEFQDLCSNNIVLVATDNTTVVAYINKEGG